ncbi:hypothetical protein CMI47_10985 [Candidatus Pacearchaeota archaeon]|nr:hypothetical protein [Candidatus Pacearchaeota archaeon]|tara:strand:- start:3613 stop:4047 length:435 start_codon:yes stop_codon:yes gene_type:complete
MPEKELIWTISSLRIDRKVLAESVPLDVEADSNPDAWKSVNKFPVDWRMWGYAFSMKGADYLVTHNGQFLNEAGYYPWVVVEKLEGGTIMPRIASVKDQTFYEAVPDGYDGEWPKSKYVRMDAPPDEIVKLFERFSIIMMFSIS